MRIIAGEFRGRRLQAPQGRTTRPTIDRVRESLMSAINSACGGFDGLVVLDAFAGSGALGLEALSRGASFVTFFEVDRSAASVVTRNCEMLGIGLGGAAKRSRRPSPDDYLGKPANEVVQRAKLQTRDIMKTPPLGARPPFNVVFLDPPYAFACEDVLGMVDKLHDSGSLASGAVVAYEHAASTNAQVDSAWEARSEVFELLSRKTYGDTVIDIVSVREGSLA